MRVPLHRRQTHMLYNMAAKDPVLAAAICRAVVAVVPGAVLLALSGSEIDQGLQTPSTARCQRGICRPRLPGRRQPRGAPGAMIENEDTAIAQVLQMAAQGTVQADDGSTVTLYDSVRTHHDGPKSPACAKISTLLT